MSTINVGELLTSRSRSSGSAAIRHDVQMKQSLGLVSLVVRDYDEALAFFVAKLGFLLVEDSFVPEQAKRWVVVSPPGAMETRQRTFNSSTVSRTRRTGALSRRALDHRRAQYPPRALPEFRAESVPLRAGDLLDDLLQIQAEVVARLEDREVLGLRHATSHLGASGPPDPPKIKGSKDQWVQ